ncbi:MAG: hypothetical protein OXT72_05505 [Gammaproteobacteria bacterium]|nr:hypothetical protein [Gammaproteobacteria bacterium]MDE0247791.1 hypothetical protein [Gammaproteobacteria bacterium]
MAEPVTTRASGNREMEGRLPVRLTELKGLGILAFANTGLCAPPPGPSGSGWPGCGWRTAPPAGIRKEVTLPLPVVCLTERVQRPGGDLPLVHGRDALLRVCLKRDEPGAFFEPEVGETLSVGGEEVHRIVMRRGTDLLANFVDDSELRHSYNAMVPGSQVASIPSQSACTPRPPRRGIRHRDHPGTDSTAGSHRQTGRRLPHRTGLISPGTAGRPCRSTYVARGGMSMVTVSEKSEHPALLHACTR